ncbi:MAG: hypothetical protein KIC68_06735 [Campylobacter concisus]|nr:hypothetical protein [Campylobacter concisus]
MINKALKLSDINFNSFIHSKNWIGFFEIEDENWTSGVDTALKLFDKYFYKFKKEVFVISALNYDDTNLSDEALAIKHLHDKFKKLGILQEPNEHFDLGLNGEILLPAICLRIDALKFDEIKDLAKLLMLYTYSLNEWCFFIFPNLNLALYPHDEKGFGCIGLNDDTKSGLNFLEFCKREKNAKVVIKEQINFKITQN